MAKTFAVKLAWDLVNSDWFKQHQEALKTTQLVVYPAPYRFVGTATLAMCDYFMAQYNELAIEKADVLPIAEGKIYRTYSYWHDYGHLSVEERKATISNDDFYIDREFAKGKILLFLDDIQVTGSHEQWVQRMLTKFDMVDFPHLFVYYAGVEHSEEYPLIPQLEGALNFADVKCIRDIDHIIKNDGFVFNTRVVKYMLEQPYEDFYPFIIYQTAAFREQLLHYAYGNAYHKQEKFIANTKVLQQLVHHPKRHV